MGDVVYMNTRRELKAHRDVLGVHQGVLQGHAELHQRTQALLSRTFWGRLRWLFTGK